MAEPPEAERRFTAARHYKRGARWADGGPRLCIRCGVMGAPRRRQATVVAVDVTDSVRLPVSYCDAHCPQSLAEKLGLALGPEPSAELESD